MKRTKLLDSAVSPVIGILLMLVVTIIIAAVVSGFAGGLISGQSKVPQAQISGTFSVTNGLKLEHNGGDAIPTTDMIVIMKNSRVFGPDMEKRSAQLVNHSIIRNEAGKQWEGTANGLNVSSFSPGESAYIPISDCRCDQLQPVMAPSDFADNYTGGTYVGGKTSFWANCFQNPANIGKTIVMEFTDKSTGKMITKSNIPITS